MINPQKCILLLLMLMSLPVAVNGQANSVDLSELRKAKENTNNIFFQKEVAEEKAAPPIIIYRESQTPAPAQVIPGFNSPGVYDSIVEGMREKRESRSRGSSFMNLCPDGTYVSGRFCDLTPNGTYIGRD